jgi:hypothetical protein
MKTYIIQLSKRQFSVYQEALKLYCSFTSSKKDINDIYIPSVLTERKEGIPVISRNVLEDVNVLIFSNETNNQIRQQYNIAFELNNKSNKYSKRKKTFTLELDELQLLTYREALEFYSRFLSGQSTYLPTVLTFTSGELRQKINEKLLTFKRLVFSKLYDNESYGIGMYLKDIIGYEIQIAYEMYREVYYCYAKEDMENGTGNICNVYNSPTLKYSDQPLPIVKTK